MILTPVLPLATMSPSCAQECCPKWFAECCPYRCGLSPRMTMVTPYGEGVMFNTNGGGWVGHMFWIIPGATIILPVAIGLACEEDGWKLTVTLTESLFWTVSADSFDCEKPAEFSFTVSGIEYEEFDIDLPDVQIDITEETAVPSCECCEVLTLATLLEPAFTPSECETCPQPGVGALGDLEISQVAIAGGFVCLWDTSASLNVDDTRDFWCVCPDPSQQLNSITFAFWQRSVNGQIIMICVAMHAYSCIGDGSDTVLHEVGRWEALCPPDSGGMIFESITAAGEDCEQPETLTVLLAG